MDEHFIQEEVANKWNLSSILVDNTSRYFTSCEKCEQLVKYPLVLSIKTPKKRFIIPLHFVLIPCPLVQKTGQTRIVQCNTRAYCERSLAGKMTQQWNNKYSYLLQAQKLVQELVDNKIFLFHVSVSNLHWICHENGVITRIKAT